MSSTADKQGFALAEPGTCPICRDDHGWVEVLPATRREHETLAHCPHNSQKLLEIRHRAENDQAARHRPRQPRRDDGLPF